MNTMQKLRVAKTKTNNQGQYKTLYKMFDEYGKFLYYQIGTDGVASEFLEDLEEMGYYFYDYRYNLLNRDKIQ